MSQIWQFSGRKDSHEEFFFFKSLDIFVSYLNNGSRQFSQIESQSQSSPIKRLWILNLSNAANENNGYEKLKLLKTGKIWRASFIQTFNKTKSTNSQRF